MNKLETEKAIKNLLILVKAKYETESNMFDHPDLPKTFQVFNTYLNKPDMFSSDWIEDIWHYSMLINQFTYECTPTDSTETTLKLLDILIDYIEKYFNEYF